MPLDLRIQAYNPLVPGDSDSSGIPVAVLRFVLTNSTSRSVSPSVCGSVRNFIGTDGTNGPSPKLAPGGRERQSPLGRLTSYRSVRTIIMAGAGLSI